MIAFGVTNAEMVRVLRARAEDELRELEQASADALAPAQPDDALRGGDRER